MRILSWLTLISLLAIHPLPAFAARHNNGDDGDSGIDPCLSVYNTCHISGFEGKDIWTRCVEPLKKGKKVVTDDGTVVAPDVPAACKNPKPHGKNHGGDESSPNPGASAKPGPSASPQN